MLCADASPVHPVLKDLLLGADVITPMVCTDAPSVEPVLKKLLLGPCYAYLLFLFVIT